MDDSVLNGLQSFERVWSRVSGSERATFVWDEGEALRGFISEEAAQAEFYSALSGRLRGASRTLCRIADEERRHMLRLQTEYFLMTGDSAAPADSCPVVSGALDALRGAYEGELAAAEKYARAAEQTARPGLAQTYMELAADEERHARMLRELVSRIIG